MAKKKTTRQLKAQPPRPTYTYRILYADRPEPELITCHGVNVYGDACEFNRYVPTPGDPDGEWVTVLAIPTHAFSRVELVEDDAPAP